MPKGTGPIERLPLSLDKEFESICWKLTEEEKALLAASLKIEGCRDPIRYWDHEGLPVVDGHNRYELCIELGVPYETIPMKFKTRTDVIEWIINNQLGRRNVSEVQKSHLRGKLHMERKQTPQSNGCHSGMSPEPADPPSKHRPSVAKQVADETGVSERRIHKDTAFAKAIDRLAVKSPTLRDAALKEQIGKQDAMVLADAPIEVLKGIEATDEGAQRGAAHAAAEAVKAGTIKKTRAGKPVVDIRALADLEKAAGALVRAKSAALEACGGKKCQWAWRRHEELRLALIPIFEAINAWQKDAQGRE